MRTRALFVLAAAFMAAFLIPTLFAGATPGPATRFPTPIVATTTTSTTTPPSFCHDGACHPLNGTGFVTDGSPQQDDEHCVGTIVQRLGCMAARRHQSIAAMLAPYQPIIVDVAAVAPSRAAVPVSVGNGTTPCGASVERWRPQVAVYPWPVNTMLRIMCIESRGNPYARNPSGATGLFQVLGGSTDATTNIAEAWDLYRHRGTQPWTCCE